MYFRQENDCNAARIQTLLPSPMTSSIALVPRKHHGIPLWLFVLLILLLVGAWSAWNAYTDYKQVMEHQYRLLEVRARQREASISGSLRSINLMLGNIVPTCMTTLPCPWRRRIACSGATCASCRSFVTC